MIDMEHTYEYVRAQLERRKDQLTKVAAESKVCLATIYNMRNGKNVSTRIINKVGDYLKQNQRKKEI